MAIRNGIDNTPTPIIIANLTKLANKLEQVRVLFNYPIIISSGYRCLRLNRLAKGTYNSAHMLGLAADFTIPKFGTPYRVCKTIRDAKVDFDQLILEYDSWTHLGLADKNRNEVLTKRNSTSYVPGLIAIA